MLIGMLVALLGVCTLSTLATASEQAIYQFTGGNDGYGPTGLIADGDRHLYGTAFSGGSEDGGTVFELFPPKQKGGAWTEATLYTFLYSDSLNGIGPSGGVVMDAHGNLYGTTWQGGSGGCTLGCGVVFELSPPRHRGERGDLQFCTTFSCSRTVLNPSPPW